MKFSYTGKSGDGADKQRVGEGEGSYGLIHDHHLYKSGLELTCNFVWVP
jgi:hypothetical protein